VSSPQHDEARVRRLAEASAWRVRLSEADSESSAAFEAWLAADPANNQSAWAEVQAPWTAVGQAATSLEVMAARRDALDRARHSSRWRWVRPRGYGRVAAGAVALAAAVACVTIYIGVAGDFLMADDYHTKLGERETVTLLDGSRVTLDSATEVKVHYTPSARRLELLSGQARFDVAHDAQRPFTVHARNETVLATGTAFNIDLLGPSVVVTLIQGRVTVLTDHQPERLLEIIRPRASGGHPSIPSVALAAGQQLIAVPAAPARIEVASLDRTSAWESGQLAFDDESLASVADRVSRYTAHPVTVATDAASLRMSGIFNAGDLSTFVDTVTHYLPVEASDAANGSIVLHRRR
jgi:transmembrane sensor